MTHNCILGKLPSRVSFETHMLKAVKETVKLNQGLALLYIDLDNFKLLNNVFGYGLGDQVLKKISVVLSEHVRPADELSRIGGDEFALILNGLDTKDYAVNVALNILTRLEQPFAINGENIYINASIGIAYFPKEGIESLEMIRRAEVAMYASKQRGRNRYKVYSSDLEVDCVLELHISTGFKAALQKSEFFVVYQPIIDFKTNKCIAVEALLRWKHPTIGVINPNDFLMTVEQMGVMSKLSRWVLEKVFSDYSKLRKHKLDFITINVNADDLSSAKTLKALLELFKKYEVEVDRIVFELNEKSLVQDPESFIKKLRRLFEENIKLAVDDYGTGYSSLSYFIHMPFYLLKIDKAFIDHVPETETDKTILKSTIKLAHDLGFKIVAEGIERKAQAEFLAKAKCDFAQGFYFSKPLELSDLIKYLKKNQ